MADLAQVCKAGMAGCCSVLLLVFGVFICFPGIALLAVGSLESDDFYDETNRHLQIVGGVLVSVGMIMIIIAIALCCYVCRKMNQGSHRQGMVLSTNPSQTTASVTTGYSSVPTNPQGHYPPQQHHQYPSQQHHQYPSQHSTHGQYPPPPHQYPPHEYQSKQQSHAPSQYRDDYGPPPPLNPDYSAAAQPSAPYPTLGKDATSPSAPPHHQMSFKR